eukprot:gene5967-8221_t
MMVPTGVDMQQMHQMQHGDYEQDEDDKLDLDDIKGKIFIGGLSWQTTEDNLRYYFEKFGELSDVALMIDKRTGKPRGFGFIKMKDPSAADIIMSTEHTIDGRLVDVKRALPRDKAPGPTRSEACKIFVGGLAAEVSEKEFGDYFSRFGPVKDAVVMVDRNTGRSRGFGFVTFEREEPIDIVLRTENEIMGKFVEVKRAEPRDSRVLPGTVGYDDLYPSPAPYGMNMGGRGGMRGGMPGRGMPNGRYGGGGRGGGYGGQDYGYQQNYMQGQPVMGRGGGNVRYPAGNDGQVTIRSRITDQLLIYSSGYGGAGGGYRGSAPPGGGYGMNVPQGYGYSPQAPVGGYAGYGAAAGPGQIADIQMAGYSNAMQQMRNQQPQYGYGGAPQGSGGSPGMTGYGGAYGAPTAQQSGYGQQPVNNAGVGGAPRGAEAFPTADTTAAGYGAYRGQGAQQGRVDRSYRPY